MIEQRKNREKISFRLRFEPMLLAALDPILDGWPEGCRFFQRGELVRGLRGPEIFLGMKFFLPFIYTPRAENRITAGKADNQNRPGC